MINTSCCSGQAGKELRARLEKEFEDKREAAEKRKEDFIIRSFNSLPIYLKHYPSKMQFVFSYARMIIANNKSDDYIKLIDDTFLESKTIKELIQKVEALPDLDKSRIISFSNYITRKMKEYNVTDN